VARDLRLQIEGDSKSARRALDDVADESDKAALTLRGLAAEMKQAAREGGHLEGELKDVGGTAKVAGGSVYVMGRQLDKAAEEMREAARAAEKLDGQLAASRAEIVKLNRELSNTDDPDKVVKALQKQYREYDKIQKVRKRIAKDEDDARKRSNEFQKTLRLLEGGPARVSSRDRGLFARLLGNGQEAGSAITGGIGKLAADIPAPAYAKAAIGVSAAPAIASLSGAALLSGAAFAGVGLGVAGAVAGNPGLFQKKWSDAIAEVSNRWQAASRGFEGPTLRAFDILKGAVDNIHLEKILKDAEKYVVPLAHGIAGFITPLANGIGKLVEKAGPVVDVLSKDLPVLGQAFEQALGDVGEGAGGAANALHDLIGYVGIAVVALGKFIEVGSKAYDLIRLPLIPDSASAGIESFGRRLHGAKTATDDTAKGFLGLGAAGAAAAVQTLKLNDALSETRNTMLAMANANVGVAQGWLDLKKELADGAKTLDTNTQAGIDNQKAILDQIGLIERRREAEIDAAHGSKEAIDAANKEYDASVEKLRAAAYAAGFNKQQVDALIASLGAVPAVTEANVKVKGLAESLGQGISLGNALNNINGRSYYATVDVKYQEHNPGISLGNLTHHARGGETLGGPIVAGEHGQEIVWPSRGSYVSTAEQTQKLVSMMARPSAGSTGTTSTVSAPPMSQLEQAFAAVFMYLAQRGVIQVPGRAVV
jgi:hypothetical protein